MCKADGSKGEMPRLTDTGVRWAQLPELGENATSTVGTQESSHCSVAINPH